MMQGEDQYTLRELKLAFRNSTPTLISLEMLFAKTHEQRVKQVEAAIDWISQEFTKTRQHRQSQDEDALTTDVILALKSMGFDAAHDKDYGGHGDIVIEAADQF